jgi:probable phosphoglycerate mutase
VKLYLVRHGETEPNRRGIALGRADVPLTETGHSQAAQLARALAGETLSAVYSSPLQRAVQTASAIAGAQSLEVATEPGLIEMDVGEMDGLSYEELRRKHTAFLALWMSETGPEHAMPGGERLVDVADRGWRALEEMAGRHPQDTIVAVSHNFVILAVITRALGMRLADFRRLRHAVAAISVLETAPGGFTVLSLNDTCHLDSR